MMHRKFWNLYFGNVFEHYDTALFSFLSPFLAPLFFPNQDPLVALILTYAMIPMGMLARPLGAFVFGFLGDTYGRHYSLFWTLAGMGFVSLVMAISPTYAQVGLIAPILFCLWRAFQNFFSAGESMGGGIFLLEQTEKKNQDVISGLYATSTVAGYWIAAFATSLIYELQWKESGWRILYLLGFITVFFAAALRKSPKTPNVVPKPVWKEFTTAFSTHRRAFFLIALVSGFSYATFSIAFTLVGGLIPFISPFSQELVSHFNPVLLGLDLALLPLAALLSKRFSRENIMLAATSIAAICALPLFFFLECASFERILLIRVCFVLIGVLASASFHAWAQRLIPQEHRYILISSSYALGAQILGGPSAAISLWLFKTTGLIASAGLYWALLGLATSVALRIAMKTKEERREFITRSQGSLEITEREGRREKAK